MSESPVRHYVFYTNEYEDWEIEPFELPDFRYDIVTSSRAGSVIGALIWVISGTGSPTDFSLCYMFRADGVEPWGDGTSKRVWGDKDGGVPFGSSWLINMKPWFAELRRKRFWSLGLFEVQSDDVINGLLDLLEELADSEVTDEDLPDLSDLTGKLEAKVAESMALSREARLSKLKDARKLPERIDVVTTAFLRNPDVIAEVLHGANGICGGCGKSAPFIRKSDGTPYLEVHHWIPLSEGGEDTLENAGALCPNCHREAHFG